MDFCFLFQNEISAVQLQGYRLPLVGYFRGQSQSLDMCLCFYLITISTMLLINLSLQL